jgi:hypothetical protein
MSQFTDAPIFDADQHMFETPESSTISTREILAGSAIRAAR